MPDESVFRVLPCEGCGAEVKIDAEIAHLILYPDGRPRPGNHMVPYCDACRTWLGATDEGVCAAIQMMKGKP